MARTSFWKQFIALMKRNITLKIRNKKHTIQEIASPIYFVVILAVIRITTAPKELVEIPSFPENDIARQDFHPDTSKLLVVAPNTADVQEVMDDVLTILSANGSFQVPSYQMYDSEDSAETAYRENDGNKGLGIIFDDGGLSSLTYTIRVPYGKTPDVEELYNTQAYCRPDDGLAKCDAGLYLYEGFISLQLALDTALIKHKTNNEVSQPELRSILMGLPAWTPDIGWVQTLSSIYFVMAYAPFVNFMVVALVTEKEKKIKEGMRMMGLRDSAFWLTWGLTYLTLLTIMTLAWGLTYLTLLTIVTLVVILICFATLLPHSNMFVFFLILTLYGLCIITMSFLVTPFFNKAEAAGGLASLATIIFSLLYLPVTLTRSTNSMGPLSTIPVGGQWALCILPPVALALAIDQALYLDIFQGGMNFSNLTEGQFPLYAPMVMMFVDFVVFGLLAVYADNVVPSEYGQKRPPYFFLQASFWCPKRTSVPSELVYSRGVSDITIDLQPDLAEPVPERLRGSNKVRIRDLKKQFRSTEDGKKLVAAVDGVSLEIYEGQITCLLGHNGAGKSTTLNMLTGMTPPTSGSATIYGYDVSDPDQMTEIRSMTGVCPQHNILLDQLSCKEHLEFFGTVKGVKKEDLQAQIAQSLKDIDLSDQTDTQAVKLSGGQKRKLCVAIALIGDPKVIFLDEPTAGMDPYSRRHLWSLLKERRPGRVILLTTHFMDEADILADRKAFISKGKLTCVGSSLFLKNRFGVGYHLSMVVDKPSESSNSIHQFVSSRIPEANLGRIHGKEVDVTLPLSAVDKFADLFQDLERNGPGGAATVAESLGIRSYGISMTSLEEVFLKIGIEETGESDDKGDDGKSTQFTNGAYKTGQQNSPKTINRVSPTELDQPVAGKSNGRGEAVADGQIPKATIVEGTQLRNQRYLALCKIKALLVFRNPSAFIFRILFPALFIIIGSAVMKFGPRISRTDSKTSIQLHAGLYSKVSGDSGNENPNMLLQLPGSLVLNTSDFINELGLQNIPVADISDTSNLLTIVPHHQGLKLYSVDATSSNVTSNLTVIYNNTAYHSFPATVNVISNTLLKMLTDTSESVTTYAKFWPNLSQTVTGYDNTVLSSVILLGLAMSSIPPAFGVAVVYDREVKARSQLRISGVTMNMYWAAIFTVDFIQFFGAAFLSIVAVIAFQVDSLIYGGAVLALVLLYLFYIPVNMFVSYVFSFAFDKRESAQIVLFNIFLFLSFLPYMAVSMLDMFGQESVATTLHYIVTVVDPCYAVFGGIYYIGRVYLLESINQETTEPDIPLSKYFEWDSKILITLIAPIFHAIWLFFILRLLEVKKTGGATSEVFCCSRKAKTGSDASADNADVPDEEDDDVQAEREKVKLLKRGGELPAIVVEGLRREYSKDSARCCGGKKEEKIKVAVRNNTFTVSQGEVFGLLGPNGAGKTTTLNMIIAQEGLTKGKVSVAGYDIKSSLSEAFQAMGYCPQHDALWEEITLKEHLICYAQLSGIAKSEVDHIVQFFLTSLHIEEHAGKKAKNLSGGTKRKLSYALSMLGEAQVVLLDEPSTGMDPKSKRFMWDTISDTFSGSSRGAILTTHYMEEADALCSRVAIMVNGQMECLGSTQHLKSKYGSGYQLEVKLGQSSQTDGDQAMKALDTSVKQMFPDPVLTECFGDRAMYSVSQSDVNSLGQIFAALEKGKQKLGIEEYSFSQSTLEQVFLQFAKHQVEDQDEHDRQQEELRQKKSSMRQTSQTDEDQAQITPL